MKVNFKKSFLVKPAQATWNGHIPLTELDQIGVLTHVSVIYFYHPVGNWQREHDNTAILNTLKDSLSEILVHFYPVAGRLCWINGGGRLQINCNGMGAKLIEAEAEAKFDDLGDFTPFPDPFNSLIPQIDYAIPIEEIPLLIVQLTKFQCGVISLGLALSHPVADGRSWLHFLSEWARLARGETLDVAPILQRKNFEHWSLEPTIPDRPQPPGLMDSPPLLIGESSSERERGKKTTTAMLELTKDQVDMLKRKANNRSGNTTTRANYSRYEAITAHIWRCMCKARGHESNQPTALRLFVDICKRVQPPLPQDYFGNAIVEVVANGTAGELVSNPISHTACRIRASIDVVTSDYVHSTIGFFKNIKELVRLQDINPAAADKDKEEEVPFYGNPNLGVVSWMNLPLYGLDFGWGKEILMTPGPHDYDGNCLILPEQSYYDGEGCKKKNGSSLVVLVCLQVEHMNLFKKLFYQDII